MKHLTTGLVLWGLIVSGAASAATITVNETTDELNSDGDCSLREAVQSANQNISVDGCDAGSSSTTDLILMPSGTYTLSLTGTEEDNASANDLDVTESLEIEPVPGDEVIVEPVDGQAFGDRAFHLGPTLNSGVDVVMHDFTIRGFRESGSGAAILAGRDLELVDMTFADNASVGGGSGGAVSFNSSNGTLQVDRSAFLDNRSDVGDGGALLIRFNAGATVSNSTFVRNHAGGNGGAVAIDVDSASLQNVTLTDNSTDGNGGGFFVVDGGELALRNSIISSNRAGGSGPDCSIAFNGSMVLTSDASAFNLVSDDTGCGIGDYTGTIEGQSAQLAMVAEYDGETAMRPPKAGSPVIDAGSCSTGGSNPQPVGSDQRQASRITGDIGTTCDIGAVERNWTPYIVDSTADVSDANPGDDACETASGECTLRAAIDEANELIGLQSIVLPEGTFTLSSGAVGEDANASGDLDITRSLIISGKGAGNTILDGAGIDRVIDMPRTSQRHSLEISNLTIRNGNTSDSSPSDGDGAGIRVNGSGVESNEFRASGLRVHDSQAPDGLGGAISVAFGDAQIINSTFDGNSAIGAGALNFSSATGMLRNVTVTGNSGQLFGAELDYPAVFVRENSQMEVVRSTFIDNTGPGAKQLGGKGTVDIGGSIVAGSPGGNCGSELTINTFGNNIEDGTDCGFGTQSANVDLAPLADIGGPVPLREPNAGSAAVDGGRCSAKDGLILPSFELGGTRPQDADANDSGAGDGTYACDSGAAERQQLRLAKGPNAPTDQIVSVGSNNVVMAQFTATNESGEALDRESASLSLRATGSGKDSADITAVRLYLDSNNDGQVDAGDLQRGATETFATDDGTITFDFGEGAGTPPANLPSGDSANYLVVVDFASQMTLASLTRIDHEVALASGSGAIALLIGYCAIFRRRPTRIVVVATAALTLVACGGGGSSNGDSGDSTNGGAGASATFAVKLENGTVRGATSGREIDLRTPAVASATISVQD